MKAKIKNLMDKTISRRPLFTLPGTDIEVSVAMVKKEGENPSSFMVYFRTEPDMYPNLGYLYIDAAKSEVEYAVTGIKLDEA